MKILLAITSLITLTVAQEEPSVSCRYYHYASVQHPYQCALTINNPNGLNNFTEIGGIHLEGFTNADVVYVYPIGNSVSTNIPSIICDTFPNIERIIFFNLGITEVDDTAFAGCSLLTDLSLLSNRIASISSNAFITLTNITILSLDSNSITTLPENVFAAQQNLQQLVMRNNPFEDIPVAIFRPLENLLYVNLDNTNMTTINNQWFTTNTFLNNLFLGRNRITLATDNFVGLEALNVLNLEFSTINEIPNGIFATLTNLRDLYLTGNNITELRADSFSGLERLSSLSIGANPIQIIHEGAFRGLETVTGISMTNCRLRQIESNSFEDLTNLSYISLDLNDIEDLAPGVFAAMPNLSYVGLWGNRLKTLRRTSFGTLTNLRTLNLDGNIVNALDRAIIDDAVNLSVLYFEGNLCANGFFGNFPISREQYLPLFETCFRNMRYIIDTITEGDDEFSFFEGPNPGIVLRVNSGSEVQIALTPFDFIWNPVIEILIGSTNNTRSVIRRNQETHVVTVPTPNIIIQNQWNDFRITWANQNILVFRSNDTFPFISYTMQDFFPINFYGLRAVESRASWSVQPFE